MLARVTLVKSERKAVDGTDDKVHLQPDQNGTVEGVVESPSNASTPPEQKDPSDVLTPDHPRFKQVIEEKNKWKEETLTLKETVAELKAEMEALKQKPEEDLDESDLAAIEKIDKALKSRGYMTKDQLYAEQENTKKASEMTRLSKEYDGSNGLPAFDPSEVFEYAKKTGLKDMELAYKNLHWQAVIQHEAKKMTTSTQPPTSEKPGANNTRVVTPGAITKEDISTMDLSEYAKNRDKIHNFLKNSSRQ